jgi:hypothetical protein
MELQKTISLGVAVSFRLSFLFFISAYVSHTYASFFAYRRLPERSLIILSIMFGLLSLVDESKYSDVYLIMQIILVIAVQQTRVAWRMTRGFCYQLTLLIFVIRFCRPFSLIWSFPFILIAVTAFYFRLLGSISHIMALIAQTNSNQLPPTHSHKI